MLDKLGKIVEKRGYSGMDEVEWDTSSRVGQSGISAVYRDK